MASPTDSGSPEVGHHDLFLILSPIRDPKFKVFTIPSVNDFVDSDRDELLLILIQSVYWRSQEG